MDELDGKTAKPDDVSGLDRVHAHLLGHLVLGKLGVDDAAGQAGRIDGRVDLAQDIGNGADVILMAMGDEIAAQLFLVALEVGRIRDNQVHAQHVVVREGHAAVDDHDIAAVLDDRHVLADLIETAQGDNLQFFFHKFDITFLCVFGLISVCRLLPAFF